MKDENSDSSCVIEPAQKFQEDLPFNEGIRESIAPINVENATSFTYQDKNQCLLKLEATVLTNFLNSKDLRCKLARLFQPPRR